MTEIEPCPFCGATAKTGDIWPWQDSTQAKWGAVLCGCGARGPDVRTGYAKPEEMAWYEDAIQEWNTRADLWQPIETIPRDPKRRLLVSNTGWPANTAAHCVSWIGACWAVAVSDGKLITFEDDDLTHWQDAPTPPEDKP